MQPDAAVTGVTHDGAFRVIAARTTLTTREAVAAQKVEGDNAARLADVLTGTILVRLTMAPGYRVQGIVRGSGGRGTLVGDSHPDGTARALIQRPAGVESVELGHGALLQVMRTLFSGAVHQGVVEVPPTGIGGALMGYFQASEQITCVAHVSCIIENDTVAGAGGYVVQLLPEVSRDPLAAMTERLTKRFTSREEVLGMTERDPRELLDAILEDMPYQQTQDASLTFGCRCSQVRVLSSLATLPRKDIVDLMSDEEPLHITCDYCGQSYELSPKALAGLISPS